MSDHQKRFGKHVMAFYGIVNSKPLKPLVSVDPKDDIDDPCYGDWLSLRDAERLGNNILKAVTHLRKRAERGLEP